MKQDGEGASSEDGLASDSFNGRMRILMEEVAPGRGKFGRLGEMSGLSLEGWKAAWHKKQRFTQPMIQFICRQRPSDARWLMVGGARHPEGKDSVDAAAEALVSENVAQCAAEVLALKKYGMVNPTGALRSVADIFESAGRGDVVGRAMECVMTVALMHAARNAEKS